MSSAYIIKVTGDTTLDPGYDTYLVEPVSNTVLTLPSITGDGIKFTVSRIDSDTTKTVTFQGQTGENINDYSSISIDIHENITVASYTSPSNKWYTICGIWN